MSRIHSALGVSPNEMLMGLSPCMPFPLPGICLIDYEAKSGFDCLECVNPQKHVLDLQNKLISLDTTALKLINQQFEKNKSAFEMCRQVNRRRPEQQIAVGDLALELDDTSGSSSAQARGLYRVIGSKGSQLCCRPNTQNSRTEMPLGSICLGLLCM